MAEYPQKFKNADAIELKFYNSAAPQFDILSAERDDFFDGAYEAYPLGGVLWDLGATPLANAIDRTIFIESFPAIYDAFIAVGTPEAYLTVFRKIFGDDVVVEFTVPAPGKLNIAIEAQGLLLTNFISREIGDDAYILSNIVTQDGLYNIVFQSIKGFTSQYELEQMLYEMVPAGIFTTITLTLGGG